MRFSERNTYQLCCHIIKNEEYRPSACVVGTWWVRSPHPPQGWARQPPVQSLLAVAPFGRSPSAPCTLLFSPHYTVPSLPATAKGGGGLAVRSLSKVPRTPLFRAPLRGQRSLATAMVPVRGRATHNTTTSSKKQPRSIKQHWHLFA